MTRRLRALVKRRGTNTPVSITDDILFAFINRRRVGRVYSRPVMAQANARCGGLAKFKEAGGSAWLKGKRGDGHPKSQAVITPAGRFGSIALAAEHYGLTRAGGLNRVRKNLAGWSYEDPT
jgi:hypothetical protein